MADNFYGPEDLTEYYRLSKNSRQKPKTNADRIRSMTDEELANMWYSYVDCGSCPMHRECNILPKDCLRLALVWLKQPAVDNGACSADETSEKVQGE